MLDLKFLRNNFDDIVKKLEHRGEDLSDLEKFGELDKRRRELIASTEKLKAERNEASKKIAEYKRENKDAADVILKMREVGDEITQLDHELTEIEQNLEHLMLSIP